MSDRKLVKLAKDYCYNYHEGQLRKGTKLPYHTHPIAVAEILDEFGYTDATTKCIALLHDVIEDSPVITGEIKEKFGYEIANGVYILSKNTINKEIIKQLDNSSQIDIKKLSPDQVYKFRLSFARKKVKRIKIADLIHNTRDLKSLSDRGIKKKLTNAKEFYIPLGKRIAPLMIKELEKNIVKYKKQQI